MPGKGFFASRDDGSFDLRKFQSLERFFGCFERIAAACPIINDQYLRISILVLQGIRNEELQFCRRRFEFGAVLVVFFIT